MQGGLSPPVASPLPATHVVQRTTHEELKSFPLPRPSDDRGRHAPLQQGVSILMATPPTVHPSPIYSSSSDTLQVPSLFFLPAERHLRKAPSADPLPALKPPVVPFSAMLNDPLSILLRHKRVRTDSNDKPSILPRHETAAGISAVPNDPLLTLLRHKKVRVSPWTELTWGPVVPLEPPLRLPVHCDGYRGSESGEKRTDKTGVDSVTEWAFPVSPRVELEHPDAIHDPIDENDLDFWLDLLSPEREPDFWLDLLSPEREPSLPFMVDMA
jgi:hypothetical protein